MKTHHLLFMSGGALLLGYAYYAHKKGVLPVGSMPTAKGNTQVDRSAVSGFYKGFTDMMKIPPEYYNNTSMEGNAWTTEGNGSVVPDSDHYIAANPNWAMGVNGGDATTVSAGWTSVSDAYSAKVSNIWQQQLVAGSHN